MASQIWTTGTRHRSIHPSLDPSKPSPCGSLTPPMGRSGLSIFDIELITNVTAVFGHTEGLGRSLDVHWKSSTDICSQQTQRSPCLPLNSGYSEADDVQYCFGKTQYSLHARASTMLVQEESRRPTGLVWWQPLQASADVLDTYFQVAHLCNICATLILCTVNHNDPLWMQGWHGWLPLVPKLDSNPPSNPMPV